MMVIAEVSTVADGFAVGKGILELLQFARTTAASEVIGAYFEADGSRIEGAEKIEIEIERPTDIDSPNVFFYRVKPVQDYVFMRYPSIQSCAHELVATVDGKPTADYWRWVAPTLPGRIYGGESPANLSVSFLVFGYKPKALIRRFQAKT